MKCKTIRDANRAGFTVMEALVALVILGICATLFIDVALWNLGHGVRLRRRALALEHTSNVLEGLRNRTWEALEADVNEEQPLPDYLVERLPEGVVRIRVEPYENDGIAMRRISVEVEWKDERRWRVNQTKPSIELVAFRGPRAVAEDASE